MKDDDKYLDRDAHLEIPEAAYREAGIKREGRDESKKHGRSLLDLLGVKAAADADESKRMREAMDEFLAVEDPETLSPEKRAKFFALKRTLES